MKLELFVNVSSSKRIFASQYTKTGIPFYRGKEITLLQNKNKINESLFIDEFIYKNFLEKYNVPQFEDIFVTAVGTIGSIYISDGHKFYFKDGNIIWLNQYDRSKIVPKYLYYYLTSYMGQSHLNSLLIGSSQQAITIDKLKSIDIRLPNLKLQQHIVDTIGSVDDLIEKYDLVIKELIVFGDAITDSIKTQLEITKLCDISLGGTPSRKKNEFWGGNNKWLNSGAVTNIPVIIKESEYITDEGIKKSTTKSGSTGDTILSIMEPDETKISLLSDKFYFNQSTAVLKAQRSIYQGSIYFGIRKSMSVIKLLKNGAAQQSINKEILSKSSVPFSENYNEHLNLIKSNMISLALKIDALKRLKEQLLNKFF